MLVLATLSGKIFLLKVRLLEEEEWPGVMVASISSWSALTEFTAKVSVAGSNLTAKTCSTSSTHFSVDSD